MAFAGVNRYTGATNVTSGTLLLGGGGSLAGTAISVASGATLASSGNYTIGSSGAPTVTINSGGILSLVDSALGTLTISSSAPGATVLTMGGGTGTFLNFDIGATTDQIVLGAGLLAHVNSGGVSLTPTLAGALADGEYALISAPGGGLSTGGLFTLLNSSIGGATLSLVLTDTLLKVKVQNAPSPPSSAYFRGNATNWNSFVGGSLNWVTDATITATPTLALPGAVTDVHFYNTNTLTVPGNLTTTLGQDFSIRTLSLDSGTGAVSISGSNDFGPGLNTLTITPTDSSTGITLAAGSGALSISAPIIVGADQTWTNNSTSLLSISGGVTGSGSLTIRANTAAVNITSSLLNNSGTIANSGGAFTTTISGGVGSNVRSITNVGGSTMTISGAPLTVNTNGTSLVNNGTTTFTVSGGVNGTGNLTVRANSTGAFTLGSVGLNHTGTITNVGAGTGTTTISGIIGANVTGVIQNSTTSAMLLSGANTFSSGLTIRAGTVLASTGTTAQTTFLGTGTVTLGNSSGASPASLLSNQSTTGLSYANNIVLATGTTGLLSIGTSTTPTGTTTYSGTITGNNNVNLVNNTNGSTLTFGGNISNVGTVTNSGTGTQQTIVNGVIGTSVTGVIQNSGSSRVTLNAVNTYTAPTTVTTGTMALGGSGSLAGTAITVQSGATLSIQPTAASYTIGATGSPSLTVVGGGILSMLDLATKTLNLNSATAGATVLTMGDTLPSFLNVEINTGNLSDQITLGSGLLAHINAGGVIVNPSILGALSAGNSFTLISAVGGGLLNTNLSTGLFTFTNGLNTITIAGNALALTQTDTAVMLSVSSVAPSATDLYFSGSLDGNWNTFNAGNTNWTTDLAGTTNALSVPGPATNVHFFATGATNLATTLRQNFTVNSLLMDNGSSTVSISGAISGSTAVNALTITPTDPLTGITSNPGAGALNISANVTLGAAQTWTNNSTNAVSVSGIVAGSNGLAVAGTGTVAFSVNANTLTGGLVIRSGTVSGTVTNSFGGNTNTLTLGDSTGGANATITSSGIATHTFGSITINAGTTGTLRIQSTASATGTGTTFAGPIALNNNLTVDDTVSGKLLTLNGTLTELAGAPLAITKTAGAGAVTFSGATVLGSGGLTLVSTGGTTATAVLTMSGATSGTGNLILNNNTSINGGIVLSNASINHIGAITNSGTGTGTSLITGTVGSAVTSINQNSASSGLTLSTGGIVGTAINVQNGALTAQGNYTIGTTGSPTVSVAANGLLSLVDGIANTLTINSATLGATVLNLADGSELSLEIGIAADQIKLGDGLLAAIASGGVVTINPVLFGPLSSQNFTIISALGGGLTSGGLNDFALSTTSLGGATLGLTITDTSVVLNINNPNTPATAYFRGFIDAKWNGFSGNTLNWFDSAGLVSALALPGATTDVHFYTANATTANLTTTLGQNFTVQSLTFDGGPLTAAVSIAGTVPNSSTLNTLTLAPSDNAGITMNAGAGAVTITAPIILGKSQSWTNNSTTAFTAGQVGANSLALNGFDLTLNANGLAGSFLISQPITGVGNLILNANSTGGITLAINATGSNVNHQGTISTSGTGTGTVTLFNVQSNVTAITQNSNTSQIAFGTGTGSGFVIGASGTAVTSNGAAQVNIANGASGSGPLVLTTNSSGTIVAPGNLTMTGNLIFNANSSGAISVGGNVTAAPAIVNSGSGSGRVTISGNITLAGTTVVQNSPTSTLALNGANTYTGSTTISAGTLALTGGSLGGTTVSAGSGTRFLVQNDAVIGAGSTSPSVIISGGAILSMIDGSANKLAINSATSAATVLTLGGLTTSSQLNFEIGTEFDQIVLGSGLKALINAGGVNLSVSAYSALAAGSWTLISAPGGGLLNTNGSLGTFNLLASSVGANLGLVVTDTAVTLNVTPFTAPASAYFLGGVNGSWDAFSGINSNWATTAAGTTNTHALPGAATDVHFSATGAANFNTTLNQNFAIQSLTMDGLTAADVAIASGGGILTIDPSASTTDPNTGILILTGSGALNISAPIVLGASQTWTNNSASLMTVSGGVSGAATLTNSGSGAGGVLISSTVDFDVTGIVQNSTGSTLTLSGVNAFAGTITVSGGVLAANTNAQALGIGAATVTLAGGTLDFNNVAALSFGRATTVTANSNVVVEKNVAGAGVTYTMGALTIGSNVLAVGGGNVNSGTTGLTFAGVTLTGDPTFNVVNPLAGGSTLLTLGALNDGAVAHTINKSGNGALTLATAATSLVAGTQVNVLAGTLNSNLAAALGLNVAVDIADGATFSAGVSQSIGAISNVTTVTNGGIVSIGGTTQTLTIGAGNLSSTFSGVITGTTGSAISKAGTGVLTLGGANTYLGATGVVAGTLRLGAAGLLPTTTAVTIANANNVATLDLNNTNQTITTLTFGGASGGASTQGIVATGGGTLTLGGNVTFTATGNPTATQQINGGVLNLGGATRTFTINDSTGANDDVAISAGIQVTGAFGVTKAGAGRLVLSGINTYAGTTTITAGLLEILGPQALPTASALSFSGGTLEYRDDASGIIDRSANTLTVTAGTTSTIDVSNNGGVTTGSVVQFGTLSMGTFTLNTTGSAGYRVGIGATTLTGNGTFNATAELAVTSVTTNVVGTARNLVLTGTAIDSSVGAVTTAGGTLTKSGTGVWRLVGNNTNTGAVAVQAGTLWVAGVNNALNPDGGAVTLGSGAVSAQLVIGGNADGTTTAGSQRTQQLNQTSATSILSVSGTGTSNAVVGGAAGGTSSGTPAFNSVLTLNIGTGFTDTYAGFIGWNGTGSVGFQNNLNLVKSGGGTLVLSTDLSNWTGTMIDAGPNLTDLATDPTRPELIINGGVLRLANTATINTLIRNTGGVIDDQGATYGNNYFLITTGGLIALSQTTDTFANSGITTTSHGVAALNISGNTAVTDYAGSDMYLGAIGARVYSNSPLTPVAGVYRLGGGAPWQVLGAASVGGSGGYLRVATTSVITGAADVIIGDNGSYNSGSGLFGGNSSVEFTAAQDYDGKTTLAGGSLVVSNANQLGTLVTTPTAGSLILDGGILRYSGITTDFSSRLTIAGGGTIDTNGQNVAFAVGLNNSNTGTSGLSNGGLRKIGAGTLTLTDVNNYAGATTVSGGTLQLNRQTGSLAITSGLTFGAGGTFRLDNTGATGVLSQTLDVLTFSAGEGVVLSQRTANFGTTLQFASLAARTPGATGNFTVAGTGATTALNKVSFTAAPTAGQFIDPGLYVAGSTFAVYDSAGFIRSLTYGTDKSGNGSVTSFTTAASTTGLGASATNADVQITGAITNQGTQSIESLRINGAFGITQTASTTLTITSGGIIKTGATATITGGTLATAGELVIRQDAAADALTIASVINAGTGVVGNVALTKSGAGTLTLGTSTNVINGQIVISGGVLTVDAVARIQNSSGAITGITLNGGTFQNTANASIATIFTLGLGGGQINANGAGNNAYGTVGDFLGFVGLGARSLTLNSVADRAMTFAFSIGDNGGPTSLIITGAADNSSTRLSGTNTYTGTTTITRGVLGLSSSGALPGGLGAVTGGLTASNTGGNTLVFNGAGANRAILQLSAASGDFYRGLGTGFDQVNFLGSGGFANLDNGTTRTINLGGASAALTWGSGNFLTTANSVLQFGVAGTNVPAAGVVDFQNPINLGASARVVDVANNTQSANTSGLDAIISGALSGATGGGLTKNGTGVLKLTGNNSLATAADAPVLVSGGLLLFAGAAAIPGAVGNRNVTVSTATGVVLSGATNVQPLVDHIAFSASQGVLLLDTSTSANIDMSNAAVANLGIGAYSDIGGTPVYFGGRITSGGIYRFASQTLAAQGGQGAVGAAVQFNGNILVVSAFDGLSGANQVSVGSGAFYLTAPNSFNSGTTLQSAANGGTGNSNLGFGNDAALGTGIIGVANGTSFLGALNGDRRLSNNITLNAAGNFVLSGNLANDSIVNPGTMSYLGSFLFNSGGNTLFARAGNFAVFLGDVAPTGGTPTLSVNSGTISFLTQQQGAVAKTFNALTFAAATTVVIDGDRSLGAVPAGPTNLTFTAAGILQVLAGTANVTLNANRNMVVGSNIAWTVNTPGGAVTGNSQLVVPGVISGGGTGLFSKTGLGTLTLRGTNTYTATNANGFQVIGGAVELDYANLQGAGPIMPTTTLALGITTNSTLSNGGVLQISAGASAITQNFTTLITFAKDNAIVLNTTGGGVTLGLGTNITRAVGGTLNFTGTALAAAVINSSFAPVNGIVPGATWNGSDLVGASGTSLSVYGGYTTVTGNTIVSNTANNLKLDGTTNGNIALAATGTIDANTLVFKDSIARSIDLRNGGTAGVLRLGAVGTLLTSTSAGALTIGLSGVAGSLTAGGSTTANNPGELVFSVNSASSLTVNSAIVNNGTGAVTIVKSGSGLLNLAGNNTFTGVIYINSGVLAYARGNAAAVDLGSQTAGAANILLNGGTLRYTGAVSNNLIYGVTINAVSTFDVANAAGIANQTAQAFIGIAGVPGILQKTGPGALTTSGATTNTNLSVQVRGGAFNLAKASTAAIHSLEQAGGAALIVESGASAVITGTGGDQILDTSSVVVKGTAVFDLNGQSEVIDGLAGNGIVTSSAAAVLTLGGATASNNLANISANTVAAAAAGMTANGLNKFTGTLSGALSLVKNGAGTQTLGGVSTYSGATTINTGALVLAAANALPSGSGKGDVTIVGNTSINGLVVPGNLDLGGFDQAVNGLNGSAGATVGNSVPLTWTGSAWAAADAVNTLTVGNNDASGSFNGVLQDGITIIPVAGSGAGVAALGTLALTKTGAGVQTLGGANLYTGPTRVTGGTLTLGVGGSLVSNDIAVSLGATYNGNATFGLAADTTLVNNGTVNLANAVQSIDTLNGTQTGAIFTLDSTQLTVASGGSFAGAIVNGTAAGGLTVAGSTLTLTGANAYTGPTNISTGTLAVNGGAGGTLGGTGISVSSTATLQITGNTVLGTVTAGTISVAAGGSLSLQNGAISTLTLANTASGSLTLSGGAFLKLDLSPSSLLNAIDSANTRSLSLIGGNAVVNLNVLGGSGSLANGTYTLLSYANGSTLNANVFTFDGTNSVLALGGGRTYTLSTGATSLQLIASGGAPAVAYWGGARGDGSWATFSGVSNDTNWLDGPTGADTHGLPDGTTDVFFTANTATNLTTTLDAAVAIKSLTFTGTGTTAAASSVTIASGTGTNTLTIGAGGVTVQTGSASHHITAGVVLGAHQTWTNNVANVVQHVDTLLNGVLTVSGTIGGAGKNLIVAGPGNIAVTGDVTTGGSITMNGTGNLVLAGNTNADIVVNSGTVAMGGHLSGAANNFTLQSGGTLSPGAVAASNAPGIGSFSNDSTSGTNAWAGGSHVTFQFNAVPALGSAGTEWDLVNNTGVALTINASASNRITLIVESLLAGSKTTIGAADGFNPDATATSGYEWLFATNVVLSGADSASSRFDVDASGVWNSATYAGGYGVFNQPTGIQAGMFYVTERAGGLYLTYSAVPEPGSLLLIGVAGLGFGLRKLRRRRDAKFADEIALH